MTDIPKVPLSRPRVLIYKRTHTGGHFRSKRLHGSSPRKGVSRSHRRGEARVPSPAPRASIIGSPGWAWVRVAAQVFRWDTEGRLSNSIGPGSSTKAGPKLDSIAPALAHHLFAVHRRVVMSDGFDDALQRKITRILALASTTARVRGGESVKGKTKCTPRRGKLGIRAPRRQSRMY
jgi:hypothetical protein